MSNPFSPPSQQQPLPGFFMVVLAWWISWTLMGAAAGSFAVLLGAAQHLGIVALPMGLAGGLVGLGAWRVERRLARSTPMVADSQGQAVRPMATWLFAIPWAIATLALSGFVVAGALLTGRREVGLGFLVLALGVMAMVRPMLAGHRLRRALAEAAQGRGGAELESLRHGWWVPAATRRLAALNLGLVHIRGGRWTPALGVLRSVKRGKAAGFAAASRALALVALEQYAAAESAIAEALSSTAGRSIQAEVDGVRLLLVFRRDGATEALELARRLGDAGQGLVFEATTVAALVESAAIDAKESRVVEVRQSLVQAGLDHLFPEWQTVYEA